MTALPPHDIWRLDTHRLGRRVCVFPRVESTNTLALTLAGDGANEGLALLAEEQTTGRGQYGRTWSAPRGSSVLLSMLVFPPPALRRPAVLTAWAALAVCETIQDALGMKARIKWPNDVLLCGKKVCGILIEQRNSGLPEMPLAAVVGIGLNVRQTAAFFIDSRLPMAASLASLSGKELKTRLIAEQVIRHLDRAYLQLLASNLEDVENSWKARLGLLGQEVVVELSQRTIRGRLLDVTWDGVLLQEGEEIVRFAPELVRHLDAVV